MKKTLAALTIVIITCTFSAGAFAYPQKQGKGKGLKQAKPRACMNLTDEQQKQLRELHQKFIDDTYEMRAEMITLDQQIRMYMETSNPDPAKLKAMVTEKADLAKDLAVKSLEFALDARKISPESTPFSPVPPGIWIKYMPMGMGRGFGGHGMGYGPQGKGRGYHGFGPDLIVSPVWDMTAPKKILLQKITNIYLPSNYPSSHPLPSLLSPRVTTRGDPYLSLFIPLFPQDFRERQCLQFQPPPDLPAPETREVYG